ncbi:MAG: diguanylate cyclase [Hyphomicrobiales bacterium]|nr:diguanylate cyclase [Hyphomicrobiales bacterium]
MANELAQTGNAAARSAGLHHVTAISGDIRRTHDFYTRLLGMRLVKRTVNFDDPSAWHLYFGDEAGMPGTILTFFSWENVERGVPGAGEAVTISFAIPPGSALFWTERLADEGVSFALDQSGGANVIVLHDPDGIGLELVEEKMRGESLPCETAEIARDRAIHGLSGVTLLVDDLDATAKILQLLGWVETGRAKQPGFTRRRYSAHGATVPGARLELLKGEDIAPGSQGAGSIHHVAFRAEDDAAQAALVSALRAQGLETTPQLDRTYFRSVYFREPSGVIFEIATDDPGFSVDEPAEHLGETVKLPPQFEDRRDEIVSALPEL